MGADCAFLCCKRVNSTGSHSSMVETLEIHLTGFLPRSFSKRPSQEPILAARSINNEAISPNTVSLRFSLFEVAWTQDSDRLDNSLKS